MRHALRLAALSAAALATASLAPIGVADPSGSPGPLAPVVDIIDVDLYMLTDIDWRPGAKLPEEIMALDGQRVRIAGYMHGETGQGVTEFWLVGDGCVCGGRPQPHHFVNVTLDDGEIDYKNALIDVIGTFRIEEVEEDGYVTSLYHIEADTIE